MDKIKIVEINTGTKDAMIKISNEIHFTEKQLVFFNVFTKHYYGKATIKTNILKDKISVRYVYDNKQKYYVEINDALSKFDISEFESVWLLYLNVMYKKEKDPNSYVQLPLKDRILVKKMTQDMLNLIRVINTFQAVHDIRDWMKNVIDISLKENTEVMVFI